MRRRKFVSRISQGFLVGGTAALWGCGDDATSEEPYRVPASAMTSASDDFEFDLTSVTGSLPADLEGHLFVSVCAPRRDNAHLFAGEGLTLRLDFGSDPVRITGRVNRTADYYVDVAVAGTVDAFTSGGIIRSSPTLGFRGQLNTAILPMDGRLLLTIDGGRPYEIDPLSLDLVTPAGRQAEWQRAFPGEFPFPLLLSSAHPDRDPLTGEIFTVNYAYEAFRSFGGEPFLDLVRLDRDLALERFRIQDERGDPVVIDQLVHQLVVTANHVLIADTSFPVEPGQFLSAEVATAQAPTTRMYLIRRADLTAGGGSVVAREITVPAEIIHFTADFDDEDGRLTLHTGHMGITDVSEWVRLGDELYRGGAAPSGLAGMFSTSIDRGAYATHVIDTARGTLLTAEVRQVVDDRFSWGPALYTYRPSAPGVGAPGRRGTIFWTSLGHTPNTLSQRLVDLYADRSERTVSAGSLPGEGRPSTLCRIDLEEARLADGYEFPPGFFASSPQFIPRAGSSGETDGYLLAAVVSDEPTPSSGGDEFWVFDAAALQDGPICRLAHPQLDIPFTLHTAWLETLEAAPRDHAISVEEDYAEALESPDTRQLFEDVVLPNYRG